MVRRPLGKTGMAVTPIGFGAFKIGRNLGAKYPTAYDLPTEEQADRLLNDVLDTGINLIDTAPAYGLSEQRIGKAISHRREQFILSTKVGEVFEDGQSRFDFSGHGIRQSVTRSLTRLRTDVLDIVLIHSDGRDLDILQQTDVVRILHDLREEGWVRAIGLSGKTPQGAEAALDWADVIMVEYHHEARSHEAVMARAADRGVGVLVKKGLASGHHDPDRAIAFALNRSAVDCLVIGGLNIDHLRDNLQTAFRCRSHNPTSA